MAQKCNHNFVKFNKVMLVTHYGSRSSIHYFFQNSVQNGT